MPRAITYSIWHRYITWIMVQLRYMVEMLNETLESFLMLCLKLKGRLCYTWNFLYVILSV